VGRQRRWTTDKRQSLRTIAPIHQQNCHPDRSEAQWRDLQFRLTCNKICFIPGGRQRRWMTDKKQVLIKLPLVFGTAGSTTNRRGAPSFAFFAKGGIRDRRYRDSWYPTLRKEREGWGTRRVVALSAEDRKCPGGRLYGKPHERPLSVPRSRKSGYAPVGTTNLAPFGAPPPLANTNLSSRSVAQWRDLQFPFQPQRSCPKITSS
jgi:hypothetical protein